MVATKRFVALLAGVTIVVSAALFAGCATYPTQGLVQSKELTYSVIGYVGRSFENYEAAMDAAKKAYPNTDAVIAVTRTATNILIPDTDFALIPWPQLLGIYAVKFEERPTMYERMLRFIFGGDF